MDIETKKLAFIEEFIKLKDLTIVEMLTRSLRDAMQTQEKLPIERFAGSLSDEDAQIFQEASQECRNIDLNEW